MKTDDWISKVGDDEFNYDDFTVSRTVAAKMLNVPKHRIDSLIKANVLQIKQGEYGKRLYIKDVLRIREFGFPEKYTPYKYLAKRINSLAIDRPQVPSPSHLVVPAFKRGGDFWLWCSTDVKCSMSINTKLVMPYYKLIS